MITLLLLTPLLGLAILLALPGRAAKYWATLVLALGPATVLSMCLRFDNAAPWQFVERVPWIPSLGIEYSVAVDGISILLVGLTSVTGVIAALCSWRGITDREKEFYAMLLLLQPAMYGVFVARDLVLFFAFFEFSLVPMYFLIGLWGGERRLYAAIKFFLYTLVGGVSLLIAIIAWYVNAGAKTFDAETLAKAALDPVAAQWIFWGIFLAFAIKTPMLPFHTWLPDAHTEAPTAGSVILAGVLLKMGTYGLLRFGLPLVPKTASPDTIFNGLAVLSIVAILYGALVSLMQQDWKRLVAYSSVSHLGFCTLGLFARNHAGIAGSVLQQVNHGISTAMLFLIVGIAYERRHTRQIKDWGGLAHVMPNYAVLFAIAVFSSIGLPLLNGFVGEFTILNGAFQANRVWAYWAVAGVVLGAAYLLWLYQRVMLGPRNPANEGLLDLTFREWLVLAPLALWAILIGVYPRPYFELLDAPVQRLVEALR